MFFAGLTSWIGTKLQSLRVVPSPIVVVILALFTSFFTEVCSNVASAVILLPICGSLAMSLGENPLLFMVPVTISCSLAFCLPVATPPNALVVRNEQTNEQKFFSFVLRFRLVWLEPRTC